MAVAENLAYLRGRLRKDDDHRQLPGVAANASRTAGRPRGAHRSLRAALEYGGETMRTLLLAGIMALASAGLAAAQDAAGGQQSFMRWCLPCHDAGDGAKIKLG